MHFCFHSAHSSRDEIEAGFKAIRVERGFAGLDFHAVNRNSYLITILLNLVVIIVQLLHNDVPDYLLRFL